MRAIYLCASSESSRDELPAVRLITIIARGGTEMEVDFESYKAVIHGQHYFFVHSSSLSKYEHASVYIGTLMEAGSSLMA